MELDYRLQQLIENTIDQIEQGNLDKVYQKASLYETEVTGLLTRFLMDFDVPVLEYFTQLPKFFLAYTDILNLELPNNVKELGDYSFYYCSELKNIQLPNMLTVIGSEAFYSCQNLKKVVIPDSVELIQRKAFQFCSKLEEITIGSGVTRINYSAFWNCPKLKEVKYNGTEEEWNRIHMVLEDTFDVQNDKIKPKFTFLK